MTVTLDLTPEQEAGIAAHAARSGAAVNDYLQGLIEKDVTPESRAQYDRAALLTLLDDLENTDDYGTAEEQRESLAHLRMALDANRPGQRRVFGKGVNPL